MPKKKYYGMKFGKGGMANMPQNVIMTAYPSVNYNGYEGLNDTMKVIDVQMKDDLKLKKMGAFPAKF